MRILLSRWYGRGSGRQVDPSTEPMKRTAGKENDTLLIYLDGLGYYYHES